MESGREKLLSALPWLWVGLVVLWAVVFFATGHTGGPLAIWIAITLGPIAVLQNRLNAKVDQMPNPELNPK